MSFRDKCEHQLKKRGNVNDKNRVTMSVKFIIGEFKVEDANTVTLRQFASVSPNISFSLPAFF